MLYQFLDVDYFCSAPQVRFEEIGSITIVSKNNYTFNLNRVLQGINQGANSAHKIFIAMSNYHRHLCILAYAKIKWARLGVATMYAPILLVGFNRPEHLKRAISSLAANAEASQSELFIAVDGPRFESDASLVLATREVAKSASGFLRIHLLFSEKNLGLAESVSRNISYVLIKHLAIIVVEDDLQVSEHFLNYINLFHY